MFYDRLKRLCEEKGTSPSAVAVSAGMSKANVTGWKNGASPKLDTIISLANELGEPVAALLDDTTQNVQ